MECVEECEFLKFKKGKFICDFYDEELELSVENEVNIKTFRCEKCIREEIIGTNDIEEKVRKIKQRIGFVMDSFYSFKDDIESEITEIYRLLKRMEDDN